MIELHIRSLAPSDIEAVRHVAQQAWHFTYKDIYDEAFIDAFLETNYSVQQLERMFPFIEQNTMYFGIAEHKANIVGFCNIFVRDATAELLRIYILPTVIGKGIGSQLLADGERFLVEKHINSYHCFVHSKNELGKQFYLHSGFTHISSRDTESEWCMEKSLRRVDK